MNLNQFKTKELLTFHSGCHGNWVTIATRYVADAYRSKESPYQIQSQKTQGFCVADFATLSDERRSRSKIFLLFIWIKEPCVRKFEGLARSKLLGISQTEI